MKGEPYNVPMNAHMFNCFWIAVLGTLYLVSTTAFGSLVTGGILLQYVSYMVPVAVLMFRGRRVKRKGWFWMGEKEEDQKKGGGREGCGWGRGWVGWVANAVVVCWGVFTCVVYSFPYVMPVRAGNMSKLAFGFSGCGISG